MRRALIYGLLATLVSSSPVDADEPADLRVRWGGAVRYGDYEAALAEIDALLVEGKDAKATKQARGLGRGILEHAWNDPALGPVLARLAVYRAVLAARDGDEDAAAWWWQVGLHLDPAIARVDLSGYGSESLAEVQLRGIGDLPSGYEDVQPPLRRGDRIAEMEPLSAVPMLENEGARQERLRPVTIELLVDAAGRISRPRVVSERVHPVLLFASLERLQRLTARPAVRDGKAVAAGVRVEIAFRTNRW